MKTSATIFQSYGAFCSEIDRPLHQRSLGNSVERTNKNAHNNFKQNWSSRLLLCDISTEQCVTYDRKSWRSPVLCVQKPFITDRVRITTEGYVFTGVCLLTGGGGIPRYLPPPHQPRYLPPQARSWWGGVPQGTYPLVRSRWGGVTPMYLPPWPDLMGEGVPQGTYPPAKVPTPLGQVRQGEGVPKGTYPPAKVPTPRDRTAYGVLDTPRSVCLLRSRRRTFLYFKVFLNWYFSTTIHELTDEMARSVLKFVKTVVAENWESFFWKVQVYVLNKNCSARCSYVVWNRTYFN